MEDDTAMEILKNAGCKAVPGLVVLWTEEGRMRRSDVFRFSDDAYRFAAGLAVSIEFSSVIVLTARMIVEDTQG